MNVKHWFLVFFTAFALHALAAEWTPLQLSLCPPVQLFPAKTKVYGLRVDCLVGHNVQVVGMDFGIANFADDLFAIQIGLMNGARRFDGIQIGLDNFAGGYGGIGDRFFPASSASPNNQAPRARGVQMGIFNDSGNTGPMSLPSEPSQPPARVASSRDSEKISMRTDDSRSPGQEYVGIQLGIANFADGMRGIQIAPLGNSANKISGLQIGIYRNYAGTLHGVQIGLINIAGNGLILPMIDQGLPIINAAF